MGLAETLRFLLTHPVGRARPLPTLTQYVRWQLASRLAPGALAMPFIEGARLLVERGMTGATGNVYVGLHEFDDMAFVLHALRSDDLFLDVGANIGSYTVLASKVVGCRTIAVEPIAQTAARLADNVALNGIGERVELHVTAVGAASGHVRMTTRDDSINRVLASDEQADGSEEIPVTTIDALLAGRVPAVMKMDVEGYEGPALQGAEAMLRSPDLKAIVIELLSESHGAGGIDVPTLLSSHGFVRARYSPDGRQLSIAEGDDGTGGNALFVRDLPWLEQRLKNAPVRDIRGLAV